MLLKMTGKKFPRVCDCLTQVFTDLKASGGYQTSFDYIVKWKTSQKFDLEFMADEV